MKKESENIKRATNVGDIIEVHKRAIKLVTVNWNGRKLKIPVYYSMNASIAYEKAFEETRNYRKSFCIMVLKIINNNKKLIYSEDDFPFLNFDDIESFSDDDLKKMGEEIIYSSDDFKEFEEEISEKNNDFFTKFHHIHKKETEKYKEHTKKISEQLKPKLYFADHYKNLLPSMDLVSKMSRIAEIARPHLVDMTMYQNIMGNSSLTELAATASKMQNIIGTYIEVINPIQIKSLISMSSALTPSINIYNETIRNYYSEIKVIKDILQPINMEYVRKVFEEQEALKNVMSSGVQNHIQIFGAELNKILNFTHYDKLYNFAYVQQDIISKIRPFLFETQEILFARKNISKNLNKKAETMLQFGWWFTSSLSIEVIDYIYENKETLKQNDVDDIISDYYRADEYKELEDIINGWNESECFNKWGKKVKDAFYAHKLQMYSLSVPVWALMIEGIIRDFMRENYDITAFKFGILYNNFKERAKELDEFIVTYAFNCMDSFYVRFNPEKPEGVHDFSRHKIFHGQSDNYDTEINSLKLIMYIDELFYMVSSLKRASILSS
ncbi:hypothetical protein [Sedimentibacter sp.]|uniref:hypothetical protein n=1 Tax=Sedimentibacter sp. TaxID=1960295 RepID=UPI0028A212B3|nr:hypothetical protein [Sedimentibacter sp.]